MVHTVTPDITILFLIVQVCGKHTGLLACFFGNDHHLTYFIGIDGFSVLSAKLNIVKGGGCTHRTLYGIISLKICHQKRGLGLPISFAELKSGALCKLAEYFGSQHFTCCCRVSERWHIGNAFAHKVAINRRRRTERSYAIAVDHSGQLLGFKVIEVIHHNRTADEPLSINLPPGGLCPSCFRNREVESVILCLMPILCCNNVRKRIAMFVDHTLRITGGTRCKVQHHRIGCLRLHTLQPFGGFLHCLGQILKAVCVLLNAPQLCRHIRLFQCRGNFFGNLVLRGTHNCFCVRGFHAVYKVTDRQHMGCGDHHSTQLVQSNCRKPIFIVPFQNQHNAVAVTDSRILKYIRHLVAVFLYICK